MDLKDIQPRYGEFYDLVEYSKNSFNGYDNLKGIYIGFNPNVTKWFEDIDSPEGYVFVARTGEDNGFKVYCTRSDRLKEDWLSDGDDGPEYPIGIRVSKVEVKLKDSERVYLNHLFARKTKMRRAA